MFQYLTKCIKCGVDRTSGNTCPLCGVVYEKGKTVGLENFKDETRKNDDENKINERKPDNLYVKHKSTSGFDTSQVNLVIIGIVLLLGILLVYWNLGYLN